MDSVSHSALTPRKTKLAHAFAKALRFRVLNNTKHHQITKKDQPNKNTKIPSHFPKLEAFLAKLFANISTVKAAYAQLQSAQSPYDADEIQSADQIIVSQLKTISELKRRYYANQTLDETTSSSLLSSEIQELNSLLITYRITSKKLDSQLKLKYSEITFLKEKLAEANSDNDLLETRLLKLNAEVSGLSPTQFLAYFRQAEKSIRSFVRLLMSEMEFAGWDLELAANSIQPGIKSNHICYAFESFVCREMFDGFNYPNFSIQTERKSKSTKCTTSFCRDKYLRLIRPKMERSIFGNLDQRNLVSGSGDFSPDTPFLSAFYEMAKHIWLLHCLASLLDNEVSIFQVSKKSPFSEVYMESLNDEAFFVSSDAAVRVAFTVVPGFRIGKTVVQCQVYLR